jgi:urease accessory protein
MLKITSILGHASEPELAARLHALSHANGVEYLALAPADTHRKRLRVASDAGTDCAIALPREQAIEDGSVLFLDQQRAIVVRLSALNWLVLEPRDLPAALELGYFAGNLHWKVRFMNGRLGIALEGDEAFYRERLKLLLENGTARIVDDP